MVYARALSRVLWIQHIVVHSVVSVVVFFPKSFSFIRMVSVDAAFHHYSTYLCWYFIRSRQRLPPHRHAHARILHRWRTKLRFRWQSVSQLFCYSIKFVVCLFFMLSPFQLPFVNHTGEIWFGNSCNCCSHHIESKRKQKHTQKKS